MQRYENHILGKKLSSMNAIRDTLCYNYIYSILYFDINKMTSISESHFKVFYYRDLKSVISIQKIS
jgi:hypothetical protein